MILHFASGDRSDVDRPISNYDYYKPLNERSRHAYSEGNEDLSHEDRNWLRNNNHKSESEELDDKPVYGYKPEEHHTSKHKTLDNESPFNDNGKKQGYFSDWTYNKLNGWKSRGQGQRDSPFKLSFDTSEEKESDYKNADAYSGGGKHPNQEIWESNDGPRNTNSSYRHDRQQIPRRPQNVELDVRVHRDHRGKNYEHSPIRIKPKFSNIKSEADLEKEAEKRMRSVHVRNKWLGKEDQYHEDPVSEYGDSDEKDGFLKDIRKHLQPPKSSPDFSSRFNHGGHSYGWTYMPTKDMRYLIDANRKNTFLKEHEKKLEEMQKKHMESFEKFMGKPFHNDKRMFSGYRNQDSEEMYEKPSYRNKPQIHEEEYPAEAEAPSVLIKI